MSPIRKSPTNNLPQVRPGNLGQVKEIARICGRQILDNKGVIRGIKNWGQFDLPRPTVKHQTQHFQGHYFIMQFDSSIKVQKEMRRILALDPRMVRFSVVKLGDKLGGVNGAIEEVTGQVDWNSTPDTNIPLDTFENSGIARAGSNYS
ncbi:ribosomal protein S6 [Exophiala spinifera]|uniref:Ribosomal protein S6 n=1 Tax=Exophiala spinifera TaxID=91928 RepID=A0A0D2BRD0_9EURO|nr:ribosomal protein S6 [Exophiala spinifera]KIW21608.1 ribosomal protein S6 [Exophiala spinifera]